MKDTYAHLQFPVLEDRPYVICNMVMTIDGKATIEGRAHGIGDRRDHDNMQALRFYADAVLSGAGTLVKEDIVPFVDETIQTERKTAGKDPFPRGVTITSRADLPLDRDFYKPEYRPTIYFSGTDPGALPSHASVEMVHGDAVVEMVAHLKREFKVDLLLCEGGPTLNGELIKAGLIDELFVTLAPKISGQSGISIIEGKELLNHDAELVSLNQAGSELFLRYRLQK
jgi:2,5-diamino-6-(ribosylamino)-4(3H)-pyrimidinone 5'-phosphate reductase